MPAWKGSKRRASEKSRKSIRKNNGDSIEPVENTKRRVITVRITVERVPVTADDFLFALSILMTK